ncbi:MAG TPA: (deoxy)nucleoside triphosphate pyrophosphohydrolase [Hyphomonadaceae bacterium]|nr:(deoxy)nucleoside triphosphate pyrophosphohydrolase [Hyphomonadaceae bacterium]HPI49737.1 (deoxy)nucleoside triphosphate pyrophosphohydrolase [Hyphomonadaceae bacterium]
MTEQLRARPLLLVAAAALVRSDGRLLLAQRPKGKAMAGLWEFPGGKVEAGESPQGALARELKEELGVAVAEADMQAFSFASHAYEKFHLLMPVFMIRRWEGEAEAREGQQLAWVSAAEIRSYPAPEADVPLFEQFIDWSKAGRA